jgi:hypothetical protein
VWGAFFVKTETKNFKNTAAHPAKADQVRCGGVEAKQR